MSKTLFKNINEAKNKFKITDFPEGAKILFNDGEEWIVIKKGMRGSGSWRNSDEITIKPFNKLAKDKNISLPIDINLEFLNANTKSISESVVTEGFERSAVQKALKDSGYDLKQSEFKLSSKKKSGAVFYYLNGEIIGNNDYGYDKLVQKATERIKEDPKKYGLSESVNEAKITIGTFVRYKKDKDDFTGGKIKSINGNKAEIHNWDGSTVELPISDLEYVKSWNESVVTEVNEGMTFDEIKDKFTENPYGIGANLVEFIEGKNGNSSKLIFRHTEKHRRDQIGSRLKTLGISPKKMSKSTQDKAYKYRYELILHENVLEETNEVNERNTKLYVYPSSKKDHQMISNWLELSVFHAEEAPNNFMFSVSGQRDADATEKYLDKEFTKLGANARFVLEGRSQIKRKYGEYGAIRVNSEAPVRNSILEFVGNRFVTRAELDSHLTQLSEDRGKAVDQNAWFKRNERYFESFSNRGSEVWTLSKYGKRVLENITKAKQDKGVIKESIGLFKFNSVNESIDVKYWADYNMDTSGQGKKEQEVKSKDFEDTFEDAVVYWNQEADGAENRIKGAQIQKIKKMAQEFFKKAGWISSNVIQAMIAQES